ncbi:MAG: DUF4288 domain-containing protein [Chloroflexi bacterium]|nr:DUF4288 domain-containing protein [Chloroflexota bacterium]
MKTRHAKKWFIACLVVASRVDDGRDDVPLVDLQYRVIHANSSGAAYRRALELGREAGHDYLNDAGERVHWEFAGLHDLHEIDERELRDGVEVYSTLHRCHPSELIMPKERLEVFWVEANQHRTAEEILSDTDA